MHRAASRAFLRGCIAFGATVAVLASCSSGSGSTGTSTASSSKVAPELRSALASVQPVSDLATASDQQVHVLLDEAGLRAKLGANADAVYALLDKTRRQAVAAEQPPDLTKLALTSDVTHAPGVQLMAASGSLATIMEFADLFAGSLDRMTSREGSTLTYEFPPSPPTSSDDGTRTVTDTISQTIGFDSAGSHVTVVLNGTITQKVTDDKTHALLAQATDSRTYRGEINVCPDTAGLVPMTVTGKIRLDTSEKSSSADTTLDLKGHVNDQAALASIDAAYENNSKWDGGSVDANITNLSLTPKHGGYDPSSLDLGNATGTLHATGDSKAGVGWAMGDLVLSANTMQPVIAEAQRLWRHGRCVVVAVPDYSVETPMRIADFDSVQHTEVVDTSSDTKFGVSLRHRFGAAPHAAVDAALSGQDKLEPDRLDAAPGSLTYTAPDEDAKIATVTLTSTSKRGIGKLVIRFSTQAKKLALSMNGTVSFGSSAVTLTAQVHAAQASFAPVGDGTYRASLPATTSYSLGIAAPNCSSGSGNEGGGSLVFNATLTKGPDDKPIWHVTLDTNRSKVHTSETVCGITFNDVALSGAGGGLAGVVASAAGVMTFPVDGGTVHVQRNLVNATFVATVPK